MTTDDDLDQAREALYRFFRREGRLPSYQEMCILFRYTSKSSAFKLTQKLIDKGIIAKGSSGKLVPQKLSMPLRMLGSVQAGFPSPAEEELLDTLTLDEYLIRNPEATFLLNVTGDSMIDAGIMPGDVVIVERGSNPKHGQIVLAQIDGEWTLKYFEKQGREVVLVAANKKYPPFHPREELIVAGVIRGSVRRY